MLRIINTRYFSVNCHYQTSLYFFYGLDNEDDIHETTMLNCHTDPKSLIFVELHPYHFVIFNLNEREKTKVKRPM